MGFRDEGLGFRVDLEVLLGKSFGVLVGLYGQKWGKPTSKMAVLGTGVLINYLRKVLLHAWPYDSARPDSGNPEAMTAN